MPIPSKILTRMEAFQGQMDRQLREVIFYAKIVGAEEHVSSNKEATMGTTATFNSKVIELEETVKEMVRIVDYQVKHHRYIKVVKFKGVKDEFNRNPEHFIDRYRVYLVGEDESVYEELTLKSPDGISERAKMLLTTQWQSLTGWGVREFTEVVTVSRIIKEGNL